VLPQRLVTGSAQEVLQHVERQVVLFPHHCRRLSGLHGAAARAQQSCEVTLACAAVVVVVVVVVAAAAPSAVVVLGVQRLLGSTPADDSQHAVEDGCVYINESRRATRKLRKRRNRRRGLLVLVLGVTTLQLQQRSAHLGARLHTGVRVEAPLLEELQRWLCVRVVQPQAPNHLLALVLWWLLFLPLLLRILLLMMMVLLLLLMLQQLNQCVHAVVQQLPRAGEHGECQECHLLHLQRRADATAHWVSARWRHRFKDGLVLVLVVVRCSHSGVVGVGAADVTATTTTTTTTTSTGAGAGADAAGFELRKLRERGALPTPLEGLLESSLPPPRRGRPIIKR
jgi:hypothetical protein